MVKRCLTICLLVCCDRLGPAGGPPGHESRRAHRVIRRSTTAADRRRGRREAAGQRRASGHGRWRVDARGLQGIGAGRRRRNPRGILGSRPHGRRQPATGRLRPQGHVQDRSRRRLAASRTSHGDHRLVCRGRGASRRAVDSKHRPLSVAVPGPADHRRRSVWRTQSARRSAGCARTEPLRLRAALG